MCNERNHSICYAATTYEVHTLKNKNKRKSLRDIFVYHFFSFISVYSQLQICYNRNTCLRHDENAMSSLISQNIKQGQVESSHRCHITKAVFKNFAVFTRKCLCWRFFLIKNFKANLLRRVILVSIAEFLRSLVLKNICEQLLLSGVNLKLSI